MSHNNRLAWLLFLAGGVLLVASYVLFARLSGATGFPLDDAWIHQTYARNLALRSEWAFLPGQVSGGSTAPLWTLLLVPGHWLPGNGFQLYTLLLGGLTLGLLGGLGYTFARQQLPNLPSVAWAAGIVLLFEWHLVWAAASGMETTLFAALILAAWVLARPSPIWAGVLAGLVVWVRPDGLTVLPFLLLYAFWPERNWRAAATIGGLATAFAAAYLGFNLLTAGQIWPTTFYAKQAEYAALRDLPIWVRAWQVLLPPLTGVAVLLIPGWLLAANARRWDWLLPLVWGLAYLATFALRLPATYQHGRYMIPAIPVFLLVGVLGAALLLKPNATSTSLRILSRAWLLSTSAILLAFFALGASAYVADTRFIDEEIVAAAHWLAENTPADALIAVHDIGAVGFFAQREIVDLAGLASPEVIPFITDGEQLQAYITTRQADYLMTFPDWPGYEPIVTHPGWQVVFQADGQLIRELGLAHMTIYRWQPTP